MAEPHTRNVAILLYDHTEILDFAGPYEVFFAASHGEGNPFNVFTVAAEDRLITCSGDLRVQPRYTIDNHPPIDILVIPGGGFRSNEASGERLVQWVSQLDTTAEIMASVCTGSYVLGRAGLLHGMRATSHHGAIEWLRQQFPDVEFVDDERVVDRGHVVTAAGVSAGIDMALHLVARLRGHDEAERVATYMEYDWRVPTAV